MASFREANMEDSNKTSIATWIKYGLAGFILGVCLVSLSAAGLFAVQIANPPPTPTVAAQALLAQAEEAFYKGDSQLVLDILSPHLEEFSNPDDQVRALQYMAQAELGLGHFQMATVYLERLCKISPTPANYMMLARIYDGGGDLKHALAYYLLYLKSDDPAMTEDVRQRVQERADQIQSILTTNSTPTSASGTQ
jgi:tetratricopeptide (TPR) repeat protein